MNDQTPFSRKFQNKIMVGRAISNNMNLNRAENNGKKKNSDTKKLEVICFNIN